MNETSKSESTELSPGETPTNLLSVENTPLKNAEKYPDIHSIGASVVQEPEESHSSAPASAGRDSQRASEHTEILKGHQITRDSSEIMSSPPQTHRGQYSATDEERSQVARHPPLTNAGRHTLADNQKIREYRRPSALVDVHELAADDVVIAVMGPTGSGKSTFIHSASGEGPQGIGHELKSYTSEVHAIRFWDEKTRRYVVLVDTPGFNDTFKSDREILGLISDWLNSSYKKRKLLSAILYLHRITDNRMAGAPLKNLQLFRKLCGKDALKRVYFTTTMWDEVELGVGQRRLKELEKEYWKEMINQGAHTTRCRSDDDSAKKVIHDILFEEDSQRALLLQEEMNEMKKELKETAAGQQLYSQLEILVEKQKELLRRIDKERKTTTEGHELAALQAEYSELRTQVDKKLYEMQELKLPWWKTLSLSQPFSRLFRR